jgi:3-dehydroquinate synthase
MGQLPKKNITLFFNQQTQNMEQIIIEGKGGTSHILVGESLANVKNYLPLTSVFIITDKNVADFYGDQFPDYPVFMVEPGEQSKEFPVIAKIWQWLLEQGADRNSFILAIGGGVVSDIAGFVAATFMRGIPFGFVASSLLAQVDASVGGKNGINLYGYKNIVGTFTQPQFVICDTAMLASLPEDEFCNGMAEVIKHAIIKDEAKFEYLQSNRNAIMRQDSEAIQYIVSQSVKIKAAVVQADEHEKGERRLLNFGHTWGHAIEKVSKIPHGQAVAVGMVFAANFSVNLGYLVSEQRDKIMNLIQDYGLPVLAEIDSQTVFNAMLKDKKREKQQIHFILIEKIGKSFVKETDVEILKEFAL